MDERVLDEMKPYFFDTYAVATSEFAYSMGIEAKKKLDEARRRIGSVIGSSGEEIIFTSGSTESSNLAIRGVADALSDEGNHIITSKTEDFPVLNSVKHLEKNGFDATYLDVDEKGFIDTEQLKNSIGEETILVSVQHANQEIGTLQDVKEIGKICEKEDVLFHTDATHTFTRVPFDVNEIRADLVTISGHTIHGPKGIGGLFVRKGTPLEKQLQGGYQERNLRAGVENIPGAIGFAKAAELVTSKENDMLRDMRNRTIDRILNEIPSTTLNGDRKKRVPQNANLTFHRVEGESITLHLDMRGFAVSTGSACFSRSLEASHVIMGISGDHERAHGSVRLTFGRYNEMEEVDMIVEALKEVVGDLRKISPLEEE
ncbi:cysteine desulfurase [candidate division MSBL1 archaeon SCGC-AAA259E19]|uniref:Cysteine desulfurase n=1 Tax=candidate division MSBL1 archaeon SCGC-AAA259E19 TaxID=1698264 RepID=A0A133UKF9_9EURY|nr:cysteine desulfurase [candidate division MSBL1 archaeon SCGC-AAA259E19]